MGPRISPRELKRDPAEVKSTFEQVVQLKKAKRQRWRFGFSTHESPKSPKFSSKKQNVSGDVLVFPHTNHRKAQNWVTVNRGNRGCTRVLCIYYCLLAPLSIVFVVYSLLLIISIIIYYPLSCIIYILITKGARNVFLQTSAQEHPSWTCTGNTCHSWRRTFADSLMEANLCR